jgi:hypothetical protein
MARSDQTPLVRTRVFHIMAYKTASPDDEGVSLDPSIMRAEVERLMPSLDELASMATDLPPQWLADTAWDDYDSP